MWGFLYLASEKTQFDNGGNLCTEALPNTHLGVRSILRKQEILMTDNQNARLGEALDAVEENLEKVERLSEREERRTKPLQRSIE